MIFERGRISLSFAGLRAPMPEGVRGQIEWASAMGFRRVTLNAAAPEGRPRDLSRSARRDLAALIRRASMSVAGVDLWLPPEHLTDPAHADRALAALLDAIDLAADLAELAGPPEAGSEAPGSTVLNTALPPRGDARATGLLAALRERAISRGAVVADHRWPAETEQGIEPPILIGLDPARMLLSDGTSTDPASAASRLGANIGSARLSDANPSGRCAVGAPGARLDLLGYLVALSTARYPGPLVIDARGVHDQERAVRAALHAASGPPV